jgi:hypothetical protein
MRGVTRGDTNFVIANKDDVLLFATALFDVVISLLLSN